MKKLISLLTITSLFFSCGEDKVPIIQTGKTPEEPTVEVKKIELTEKEKQIVDQTNVFAFNFFRTVAANEDPNKNILVSPLSASLALCMLNNGANGPTHDEIQQALGFGDFTREEMNSYFKKIIESLKDLEEDVTFETANSIWIDHLFPVLAPFINVNQEYYDAEVRNEDFNNPETLKLINNWCSEKTHGKIPEILNNIDASSVMYLINALYFKGVWGILFDKDHTRESSFNNLNGSIVNIPMMNKRETSVQYTYNEQCVMAEVPYGLGAFSMVFLLPKEDTSLSQIVEVLDVSYWLNLQSTMWPRNTNLKIPRFKVEYERDINDDLKSLGMNTMFSDADADFSLINDTDPIFVSLVKQKTNINVNEEGSEATAVTIIGMVGASGIGPQYQDFFLDKPFLYFIKEQSTGAILFMGQINNLLSE